MGKIEVIKEDEIDLLRLAKSIWSSKIFLTKVVVIFGIIGSIIAFTSNVEFEAYSKLLPESQEGLSAELGGLGGLAGLAGFDLSGLGSEGAISPEIYPEIVSSVPFLVELINTPIYFEKVDTSITSFQYFKYVERPSLLGLIAEYTIGLPSKIKNALNSSGERELNSYDFFRFSKEDWEIIEDFQSRLTVFVDAKTGTITVSVEMPDAVAAASLTKLVVNNLTQSVIRYKVEKSQMNLEFVHERFDETKLEYEAKQERLARFTDRNRNISNSLVQTEYERLQNELDISFEVYKSLASQLEQAKIKVKEDTPIFSVLEPVKIPEEKSKPKIIIIMLGFVFLGLIFGSIKVIIKELST